MSVKKQLKSLEQTLANARDYNEWFTAAQHHDELSGMADWREVEHTDLYDYAQIRMRLDRLRSLRGKHDFQGLLFALNEGIHGNMGGMGKSVLYRMAKVGTKRLVEDYIDEIDASLRVIAELDDRVIPAQEKLEFFYRCNICFGRTALMLSGGGALGFLHLGVVNCLAKQKLLPRVISGSSAGALVAGVLGTHNDDELESFSDPRVLKFATNTRKGFLNRLVTGTGAQLTLGDIELLIERVIPDMTFEEAYARTGRQISITVAPAEPHQRSRLLNAITSPNVYIRSAVMASCAIPGVFPSVMLKAKNVHGEAQPYLPGRRWVDGSLADDLPAKRLSRLFGTNHSIVSMVNPVATAFLPKDEDASSLRRAATNFGVGLSREVLNFYRGLAQRQGDNWPRFNMMLHGVHALLDQQYTGDINIVPSFKLASPLRLLTHFEEEELVDIVALGEHACFEKVEAIRRCTQISRTLEELLYRFEYGDLRPDPSSYRRPRSSRRRPQATARQLDGLQKRAGSAPKTKPKTKSKTKPKAKRASSPSQRVTH